MHIQVFIFYSTALVKYKVGRSIILDFVVKIFKVFICHNEATFVGSSHHLHPDTVLYAADEKSTLDYIIYRL